jgi:hypothetical protein
MSLPLQKFRTRHQTANKKIEDLISTARPTRRIAQRVMLKCALLPSVVMIPSVLALSKGGYSPCSLCCAWLRCRCASLRAFDSAASLRERESRSGRGNVGGQSNKGIALLSRSAFGRIRRMKQRTLDNQDGIAIGRHHKIMGWGLTVERQSAGAEAVPSR